MIELIEKLNELKEKYGADGIKIYFMDENNYTVKFIKDEKVIIAYRKRGNRNGAWDMK